MAKSIIYWLKILSSCLVFCSFISCEESEEQLDKNFIVLATEQGFIVDVEDRQVTINGIFQGLLNIEVAKFPIATCGIFGYDWLCTLTGSKGRAIAKEAAEPESSDFANYAEVPSEAFPEDMTSTTYFSKDVYAKYGDTSANYNAMRATVATWDPPAGWVNARIDWCTIDHPLFCNQN